MNKQFLYVALVAVVGFFGLTAFGGKTKADQLADINKMVTGKVEELRTAKTAECDARVASTARAKFDEMAAAPAPAPDPAPGIAKPSGKKKPATKTTKPASGPSTATPLPVPTPAPAPNPKAGKLSGEAPAPNTEAKSSKMSGEAPAPNTSAKSKKLGGGGTPTPAGGGN